MDARVVMHLNLSNAKSSPLSHDRYKAMKLTIEFQVTVFDYFSPICLKSIIDVMQMNACHPTHQAIKHPRWKCFCNGIETREFPTRYHIIPFIDFLKEIGYLFGIVL